MLFHCQWPEKKKQLFFYTSRIWSWQEHAHLTDEKNQGANEFGSFPRNVQLCGKSRMWTPVRPLRSVLQPRDLAYLQWLQPYFDGLGQGGLSGASLGPLTFHESSHRPWKQDQQENSPQLATLWDKEEGNSRLSPREPAVGSPPEQGRSERPLSITPFTFTPEDPHSSLFVSGQLSLTLAFLQHRPK